MCTSRVWTCMYWWKFAALCILIVGRFHNWSTHSGSVSSSWPLKNECFGISSHKFNRNYQAKDSGPYMSQLFLAQPSLCSQAQPLSEVRHYVVVIINGSFVCLWFVDGRPLGETHLVSKKMTFHEHNPSQEHSVTSRAEDDNGWHAMRVVSCCGKWTPNLGKWQSQRSMRNARYI